MRKFLETVFGPVFVNKIAIAMGEAKSNPVISIPKLVVVRYVETFEASGYWMRVYMAISLACNAFIFTSLFAFVAVMVSNAILVRNLTK